MSNTIQLGHLPTNYDLTTLIKNVALFYKIGTVDGFNVIEIGYEDLNIKIKTSRGLYLAKIFSKNRTADVIDRYVTIMHEAIKNGVNHPKLLTGGLNSFLYKTNDTSLVLMKFIEGKTFFELDRAPDAKELREILQQATLIHKINYKPSYYFDDWAIPNITFLYDKVTKYIAPEDLALVDQVIATYKNIPIHKLPHCFVHGDFTKTNIIKSSDGKIYILDFSVSNLYPRIQELAVIAANLTYDKRSALSIHQRCKIITEEYEQFGTLTKEERKYLPTYALAGVVMEFMGAHLEKFTNGNNSEETNYWLELGRNSLRGACLNSI